MQGPLPLGGGTVSTLPSTVPAPAAAPAADVQAHITVGGDLSGQVAVGNNIVQLRVDSVHGDLVVLAPPERAPAVHLRPPPLRLLPRPVTHFLDRTAERRAALDAVREGEPLEFTGPAGVGKTTLLRHLARHPAAAGEGGVVHLSLLRQSLDDALQSLFDVFYASDQPFKPSRGQLGQLLQPTNATVLLDDVDLDSDEAGVLVDLVPGCGVLLAAGDPRLAGRGRTVRLQGLPGDEAAALLARASGRPLPATAAAAVAARPPADRLPLRLLQEGGGVGPGAAARPGEGGGRLDEGGRGPGLGGLGEAEWATLAALAAVPGIRLDTALLAAATGQDDPETPLASLLDRGLVQASASVSGGGSRFSLAHGAAPALGSSDLAAPRARLRRAFLGWSDDPREAVRRPPDQVDAALTWLDWAGDQGAWEDVLAVGRALDATLTLQGRWDAWHQLLRLLGRAARAVGDAAAEAQVIHQMGTRALCLGDAAEARRLLEEALRTREELGDTRGAEATRHNLDLLGGAPPPPDGEDLPAMPGGRGLLARALPGLAAVGVVAAVVAVLGLRLLPATALVASPSPLVAGERELQSTGDPQTLTVTNTGRDPVTVETVRVEGPQAGDFLLAGTTCEGARLAAQAACTVAVQFSPTGAGNRSARLVVAGPDGGVQVALSGDGTEPPVGSPSLEPAELRFGPQEVGTTSAAQAVTLRSPSGEAVESVTIRGQDAGAFALGAGGCALGVVPPAEGCSIPVSFAPQRVGVQRAALSVRLDGVPADLAVVLEGSGDQDPGEPSEAQTVTVPDVVGEPVEDAVAALRGLRFAVEVVKVPPGDAAVAGVVVRQQPAGGTDAAVGSMVRLEVPERQAPEEVEVACVEGLDVETALVRLRRAGFGSELVAGGPARGEVAPGTVVAQDPACRTFAPAGAVVTLALAEDPGTLEVPRVIGLTFAEARAVLGRANLSVSAREVASREGIGTVVAQDPAGGSEVEPGTTVTLDVATPPPGPDVD